ncbi:MAG TPA: HEAT repeat domain-containing protein [Balneolaceae bacterium]
MINDKYIELVTAYLDDSISPEERVRLNELIDEGKIDILDVKEMENLYKSLGKLPVSEPSEQMRDSFYAMLKAEKEQQTSMQDSQLLDRIRDFFIQPKIRRFGLAMCLFLVGMVAGNFFTPFQDYEQEMDQLSNQVMQMQKMMALSLLDAPSSTERLKAVNISSEISSADDRIVSALLKTLNNDPNVNVRLASIDALLNHAANPAVRKGLVQAISKQESPQIQVALANAMLALQETRSVDELRRLLDRQELDPTVRYKLTNTIAALKR